MHHFFVTYKSYNILLLKKGVWQLCLLPTITVEFCNVLGCQLHNSVVHLIFRSPFVVMILAKCQLIGRIYSIFTTSSVSCVLGDFHAVRLCKDVTN